MSSRRPADDAPNGQPETKKPKMDIAAIRAQLAAKKAAISTGGGPDAGAGASASASSAVPAPVISAINGNNGADRNGRDDPRGSGSGRDREEGVRRTDNGYDRDRDRDRRHRDGGDRYGDRRDRDRERDRDRYDPRDRRDSDRDRDRYRRDDRDRERDRDRDYRDSRDRGYDNRERDRDRERDRYRDREPDRPRDREGDRPSTSDAAPRAPGPAALPPSLASSAGMSVQDRVAAVKARIDAMNSRNGSGPGPAGPQVPGPAGLSTSIALHPLLMGDGAASSSGAGVQAEKNEKKALRDRYKTMAPKFSTVRANQAAAAQALAQQKEKDEEAAKRTIVPSLNPYLSGGVIGAATDGPAGTASPAPGAGDDVAARIRDRRKRQLQFARPGRYVEQGDQLRNEQKMEALKQRIAEASKKAGLEGEFDTLEKSLKRQPPPDVEWWDKAILPDGTTYDKLDETMAFLETNEDSLITHLVQHPIPIPAVGDKKAPERGLMLTKKEAKKLRRQRRMAELEDKRDRQKMGLLPPDAPKVRLANLMKVLTSDAVQDPTKVEAKVRKEVAARANKHEQDNAERKLSAEERKEKEYQQMLARERKGLYAAVFKVKYLSNGQHKFKVRETAKKDLLSGICLFGKDFAIVVVEGVDKSVKHYKKLMLSRIDWTEQARARPGEGGSGGEDSDDDDDAKKNDGDLADNKCEMIWEGEVPERSFKLFRARHAETDSKAKEWLGGKWEGMWDLAKRWAWQGEEM